MFLRRLQRRVQTAVDTDLDEPHQRRGVARDARHELLQRGSRSRPVTLANRNVRRELQGGKSGIRYVGGNMAGERSDLRGARRIFLDQLFRNRQAIVDHSRPEARFGNRQRHVQQSGTDRLVAGRERHSLAQHLDGVGLTFLLNQRGRDVGEVANRPGHVVDLDARVGGRNTCVEVCGVERPDSDAHFGGSSRVATCPAALDHGAEMRTRIGIKALLRRNFTRLQQRMLMIGFQFEDLLVEGRPFREKPLFAQVVGDADELIDGLVGLSDAHVQIAEEIGGIPVARLVLDHAQVLCNRGVDLSLPHQFLSVPERCRTVDGHGV